MNNKIIKKNFPINSQTSDIDKLVILNVIKIIKKNKKNFNSFAKIGKEIGLLFQIVDDLIDFKGKTKIAGKKTKKDIKQGKATIISLLGYENAVKYAEKLKQNIYKKLRSHKNNADDLKETIDFIMERKK